MATVTFEGVTKRFQRDVVALRELDLEIRDGEFMILVGPSGCGKSTTLRLLAGLEEATEGVIKIGDEVVNDVPPRRRDIAMVFQSYALYPHMTVAENMGFGLRMRGVAKSEIRASVRQAAETLGLAELLERKPGQLSGGQRQRVALGRAIVRHPQVFLLDEPLSNLDAQLRAETRVSLQKLHKALDTTFIYVTHDQVEAMTMGDRIAVLRDGVLQQVAPPRELYERPANMYVAGFIGTPKMNFIRVAVDGTVVKASGFELRLEQPVGVREAMLGIRPEAFVDSAVPDAVPVELAIDVFEILGSDQLFYGKCGSDDLVARADPQLRVAAGDRIKLGLNQRRLHLFDVRTEEALGAVKFATETAARA